MARTRLRIGFAGTPEFAARHLRALAANPACDILAVWSQPDRQAGRGRQSRPGPVSAYALEAGLPLLQPERLDAAARADLQSFNLDLLVVVAYGLILPQAVLDAPRLGCVNLHASLLPRWRGAAPIQRAIEAGDTETGVCIMQMDAGLDTGPVMLERRLSIHPRETAASLHDRLSECGAELLSQCVSALYAKPLPAHPQSAAGVTYAAKISKDEAEIDWTKSAAQIDRQVRAFNPAPGAFGWLAEERIKILLGTPLPATTNGTAPGALIQLPDGRPAVTCGEGLLALDEVQLPGRRAMPIDEAVRGNRDLFAEGAQFRTSAFNVEATQ